MIKIALLKDHPEVVPHLARIWHEVLGKIWMPEIGIDVIETLYYDELNQDIPLTCIALDDDTVIGSCTFALSDEVRPDLGPWIESLVVDAKYQRQGIGTMLLDYTVEHAKKLGYQKLYLFAFDPALESYYQRFRWKKIGIDDFKSQPVTLMELVL